MNETWSSIQIRAIEENPANVNVDFLGSKEWPNPKLLGKNGVNNQALNSATRKHFEKNSIKAICHVTFKSSEEMHGSRYFWADINSCITFEVFPLLKDYCCVSCCKYKYRSFRNK